VKCWARLKAHLPKREHVFVLRANFLLFAAALFTILVVTVLSFSGSPRPYVAINAVSEFLSYRVARPPIAAIPLVEATLRSPGLMCPMPFTGILEPARGAVVRYRSSGDKVAIEIAASDKVAATLRSEDARDCEVNGSLTVVIDRNGYVRALPIAGPADIGAEFSAPTMPQARSDTSGKLKPVRNIMWEGSVQAFTRGYLSGGLSPKADAEFKLPAGGRISSGDTLVASEDNQNVAPWYGIAEITENGLAISATTTTLDLKLYRPGTNRGDAETFRLDFLTNIFSDPTVIRLIIIFAIFSYVTQILGAWMGHWKAADAPPRRGGKA